MKTLTKITNYHEAGRKFTICEDNEGFYWAIEDKHIDADGRINTTINGLSGFRSETEEECIERLSNFIQVEALVASGMDRMDATIKVLIGSK